MLTGSGGNFSNVRTADIRFYDSTDANGGDHITRLHTCNSDSSAAVSNGSCTKGIRLILCSFDGKHAHALSARLPIAIGAGVVCRNHFGCLSTNCLRRRSTIFSIRTNSISNSNISRLFICTNYCISRGNIHGTMISVCSLRNNG